MEKIMRLVPPSWDLEPLVTELENIEAIINTIAMVQPGDLDPNNVPILMNIVSDKVLGSIKHLKDLYPYVNERSQVFYEQHQKDIACSKS